MNLFFVLSLVWVLLNDINSIQGSDDDDYEPNESDVQMFFSSCQALKNKYIVRINEVDQELLHNQAELNCYNSILNSNDTSEEKVCSTTWDTVLCWPQTPLNKTIRLQCPNYINKFNTRSKNFIVRKRLNSLNLMITFYFLKMAHIRPVFWTQIQASRCGP